MNSRKIKLFYYFFGGRGGKGWCFSSGRRIKFDIFNWVKWGTFNYVFTNSESNDTIRKLKRLFTIMLHMFYEHKANYYTLEKVNKFLEKKLMTIYKNLRRTWLRNEYPIIDILKTVVLPRLRGKSRVFNLEERGKIIFF